jgi:hypothetical protein
MTRRKVARPCKWTRYEVADDQDKHPRAYRREASLDRMLPPPREDGRIASKMAKGGLALRVDR